MNPLVRGMGWLKNEADLNYGTPLHKHLAAKNMTMTQVAEVRDEVNNAIPPPDQGQIGACVSYSMATELEIAYGKIPSAWANPPADHEAPRLSRPFLALRRAAAIASCCFVPPSPTPPLVGPTGPIKTATLTHTFSPWSARPDYPNDNGMDMDEASEIAKKKGPSIVIPDELGGEQNLSWDTIAKRYPTVTKLAAKAAIVDTVKISNSLDPVVHWIDQWGAVQIGVDIYDTESKTPWISERGERSVGGHAMAIVGYKLKNKVVVVENSWGKKVGDNGLYYMPVEHLENAQLVQVILGHEPNTRCPSFYDQLAAAKLDEQGGSVSDDETEVESRSSVSITDAYGNSVDSDDDEDSRSVDSRRSFASDGYYSGRSFHHGMRV